MSHKSDESIEKFFRKAAVQQDKTFMERDWQSMEKMLDEHAMSAVSQGTGNVKTIIKVSALLLIVSSLFFIGMEKGTTSDTVQMQAVAGALGPRVGARTENPTADLHLLDRNKVEVSTDQFQASLIKDVKPAVNQAQLSGADETSRTLIASKATSNETRISNDLFTPQVSSSAQRFSENQQSVTPLSAVTNSSKGLFPNDAGTLPSANGEVVAAIDETVTLEKTESQFVKESPDSVVGDLVSQSKREEEILDKEEKKTNGFPQFSITALFSPDFSTTSLTKYSKPSGVFGVMLGFKISPRFTVSAGATRAMKKYEGYGDDYSPPQGYWQNKTNGVVPDEVEGNCGIVEVPLILQYDIVQRARSRFFVSAGVSSYFMRSEHYQYTFNEPNPGAANSWTAREPSQYLFKIGHLSAGYDRVVSRHFSVGVEPFLKVPFEGIGWTDINLYSTGAYLNLRYFFSTAPKL